MRWKPKQLKDPRWQKKRLKIFERDGWRCCVCQRDDVTLHVHHLTDKDGCDPWEYTDDEMTTVCQECHYSTHKDKGRLVFRKLYLESLQKNGWDRNVSIQLDRIIDMLGT